MEQLYAVLILILGIAGLIYFGLLKTIFIEFALFLDPSITQDKISTLENLNQGQLFGQPEIAQVTNFMTATGLNGFLLILVTLLLVQGLSNLLSEKPPFLIAIILKRKLLNFELLEDLSWTNKFFINWYLYSFDKILSKNAGLINSERDHLFSINSIEFSYKDSFESEFIIKALKQSRVFLSISRSLSLLKFGKFRLLGNQNDDLLFRDLYSFLSSIINSYSQSRELPHTKLLGGVMVRAS